MWLVAKYLTIDYIQVKRNITTIITYSALFSKFLMAIHEFLSFIIERVHCAIVEEQVDKDCENADNNVSFNSDVRRIGQ